jgi:hypothetical protein
MYVVAFHMADVARCDAPQKASAQPLAVEVVGDKRPRRSAPGPASQPDSRRQRP